MVRDFNYMDIHWYLFLLNEKTPNKKHLDDFYKIEQQDRRRL